MVFGWVITILNAMGIIAYWSFGIQLEHIKLWDAWLCVLFAGMASIAFTDSTNWLDDGVPKRKTGTRVVYIVQMVIAGVEIAVSILLLFKLLAQ